MATLSAQIPSSNLSLVNIIEHDRADGNKILLGLIDTTWYNWLRANAEGLSNYLAIANNLSDLNSVSTARTNLGVPSLTGTGASGTWGISISGTAATVTTNANLTGPITSVGNATSVASQTGTGSTFVMNTSPTLVTPLLGTPTSGTLTNCTGYKDQNLNMADVTTNNVTASQHGFAPKAPNDAATFLNGANPPAFAAVKDSDVVFTDISTNNANASKHGYAPKCPADATQFLNGANPPAYALVKDSDLSTSDITTNNASITKHGFIKKLDGNSTSYFAGDGNWTTVPTNSYLSSLVADSSVSLTTATAANITSLSLTAGKWLVFGTVNFAPAATTTMTTLIAAISTTSATIPSVTSPILPESVNRMNLTFTAGGKQSLPVSGTIVDTAGTTTVYLVCNQNFATSTLTAGGRLVAMKIP